MVEKITPDRERSLQTYTLLLAGLNALATSGPIPTVVPAFLVKLLSVSGYHPQLSACAGCEAEVARVTEPDVAARRLEDRAQHVEQPAHAGVVSRPVVRAHSTTES